MVRHSLQVVFKQAKAAQDQSDWRRAIDLFRYILSFSTDIAEIWHNLAICYLGTNHASLALHCAQQAMYRQPRLWQSGILIARSLTQLGQIESAYAHFAKIATEQKNNGLALLGMADLALNEFGDPLSAIELVSPLHKMADYQQEAELTTLMASLYDRDISSTELVQRIKHFANTALHMPGHASFKPAASKKLLATARQRIGLISPLFCASPVYFLTIFKFRQIASKHDLIIFNRGSKQDWATTEFYQLAHEKYEVQHIGAQPLTQILHTAQLDLVYDLGGWTDPIALQALSTKPARKQLKWIGGQSITTGLTCFDGWLGDPWQSPLDLQYLYSEPLLHLPDHFVKYTPPPYMPQPAQQKTDSAAIFANPAKVSRAFLQMLRMLPGKKCFIHRQYQYARVRERIEAVLGHKNVEYICPSNHAEALQALNQHKVMLDTFPYTGGLTAREALALGVQIEGRIGKLFCERHTAAFYLDTKAVNTADIP